AQKYLLLPAAAELSDEVELTLFDPQGQVLPTPRQGEGNGILATLSPGEYVLRVEGRATGPVGYRLLFLLNGTADNAPPRALGPAPVIRTHLLTADPSPAPQPSPAGPAAPV